MNFVVAEYYNLTASTRRCLNTQTHLIWMQPLFGQEFSTQVFQQKCIAKCTFIKPGGADKGTHLMNFVPHQHQSANIQFQQYMNENRAVFHFLATRRDMGIANREFFGQASRGIQIVYRYDNQINEYFRKLKVFFFFLNT